MADVRVTVSHAPRAVITSSLLTMLAIAALGVTRLVHLSLVGRNVPAQTFEMVGILISVTMTAGLFLPGGMASAAAKFIPQQLGKGDPAAAIAVYRLLSFAGYLISAALGAIVGFGAVHYGVPALDGLATGLLTFAFSVYSIEKSAFYGFHRVAPYVRLELIGAAVAIGSTVVVIAAGWHAYLLPLTLGYSVLILGAWLMLPRRNAAGPTGVSRDRHALPVAEMAGYVGLAGIGGLAGAGLLQALPALAGAINVDAVRFVTGVGLVAPLYFLPRALGMALFPAMAHAHGAGDLGSVRTQADVATRGLFALLAPLFAVGAVLAEWALVVVYGPRYAGGALVLRILLVATFLMMTQVAAVNALSSGSRREVRIPVTSSVAGALVGIAAAVPLGLAFGATGVALAYLFAATISAAGPLTAVSRTYDMAWLGPITRALAVVAGAVLAAVALEAAGGGWLADAIAALITAAIAVAVLRGDIRRVLAARPRRPPTPREVMQ